MKTDFGKETFLFPMPVLIIGSYDENGNPDAMNAAWGGICNDNQIGICLSASHKTVKNILATKAFTVAIADAKHVVEADYLGIVSANKVPDKIEKAGLHTTKSKYVNAPVIDEFPMTLECEFADYENGFLRGNIINVCADNSVLTENKIDPSKLSAISFDPVNCAYLVLGEKVGNAFSDGNQLKLQ